ncbi:DNA-binding response regulator [Pseudoroseomonas aestuarii]|uniref:Regulatory protein VirG n=1 Tax=Teichococcus aestuarii TaxID=568898 RepID=A0A2U1UYY7_9PROT|nr:DNA-binding response regulator [Pseudoroseomonas aestuarii]
MGGTEAKHILVVDDDEDLRRLLLTYLRRNGFRATGAQDGTEMSLILQTAPVDAIVLDVMMPGQSGFDICRSLRMQSNIPIILLTALGETVERVLGLELGADDFVVKPAEPREIVARIRAVLRRTGQSPTSAQVAARTLAHFDGWTLDTRRRELRRVDGVEVELTGGEYDLLLALIERPQQVLNREQLLDLARNRPYGGLGRSMDVQISRLRAKLGDHADLIRTVRGSGYMLTSPVRWA